MTLLHPCQTVWSVTQTGDGDIITGGSDGGVRVWTQREERSALPEIREVSPGCNLQDPSSGPSDSAGIRDKSVRRHEKLQAQQGRVGCRRGGWRKGSGDDRHRYQASRLLEQPGRVLADR